MGDIGASTGNDRYAGWSLIVAYRNPAAPLRDLEIFKGFSNVTGNGGPNSATIDINGFLTPAAGDVSSSIGVVTWEGDRGLVGDGMQFNGTPLSGLNRPADELLQFRHHRFRHSVDRTQSQLLQ